MKLIDMLKRIYRSRLGIAQDSHVPPGAHATFNLVYDGVPVGVLSVDGGQWVFRYTDEFKHNSRLRPIVEFPDTSKVYQTQELWPFFGTRIPSLKQAAVQEIVKNEQIDAKDQLQLLRRFGKRTITSPFVLVEA